MAKKKKVAVKPKQVNVKIRKSLEGLITANYVALRRIEKAYEDGAPMRQLTWTPMPMEIVKENQHPKTPAWVNRFFEWVL